ncbi:WD40 repeat domain-containing protein [Phanerochaete sordida]|uniref:WD40 repeat domain-containing protein n=1 Tax=Phanerochaete sordida TaxID=48140 RepID=A0A9P3GL22_9APHY|nr:WD40 repeat domain-containing protein [Phanerochaete sordida]
MYRLHRFPSAPDKIYSSSLKTLYLGHGMWYPEPHESGEPQIGDVGFLKEGAFIRLFNLDTAAPEKKVTYWDPPFEISDPPPRGSFKIDHRARPLVPRHYRSHGVQRQRYHASASLSTGAGVSLGIDAEYTCKASQGAVLALKSEAHAQTIFENIDLKEYVLRHHDSWCTYVRDVLRQNVKPSAIVMVSGWVKTDPDWAAAAFSNVSSRRGASLTAGAGSSASVDAGFEQTDSVDGPEMHRHGEHYLGLGPGTPGLPARDQSVFLKRYKVRRRLGIVRTVVAGAGYHRLPRGSDGRGGDDDEHVERGMDLDEGESEPEVPDLVDTLLDYMFETTSVETAVASDDDVACIVGEDPVEEFASLLRARQPPVEVDGSVGFLRKEGIIRHQRERDVARRAITKADVIMSPNISMDGASKLDDVRVFVGPTAADVHPLKLGAFTFIDSHSPSNECTCFTLSPDGKLLVASFGTSSILLWRMADGLLIQQLQNKEDSGKIACLGFSPDGKDVLSGLLVGAMATVWDYRTGAVALRLGPHQSGVTAIACSPYESRIVTGDCADSTVHVWDRQTGQNLANFRGPKEHIIHEITFIPPTVDSANVYVRSLSQGLVYNLRSSILSCRIDPLGDMPVGEGVFSRSVSHHGNRVLVKTIDQGLQLLDTRSGELCIAIPNSDHFTFPAAFSPDDKEVYATCTDADAAHSFDSRTGEPRHRYEVSGPVIAGAYSPDGAYIAFCTRSGNVHVHDPMSGSFLAKVHSAVGILDPRSLWTPDMAFVQDGRNLVVRKYDIPGAIRILNISDMMRAR